MTKSRKSPSLLGPEVPPLAAYRGPVEGMLRSNDSEILRELLGVIEATRDKNIKLTKSGIPPKPLWSAINERLLWQDPKSVLYDWDEVDQVRFVYSLAEHLMLVHRGQERVLGVGPGADQFFLALPTRRAEMLMRAYMATEAWDERCDARNATPVGARIDTHGALDVQLSKTVSDWVATSKTSGLGSEAFAARGLCGARSWSQERRLIRAPASKRR
jgi:hypothetical protein